MASAASYVCASYINGGSNACANKARFRRDAAERVILEGIRRELASPTVVEEVLHRVRSRLREISRPRAIPSARRAELETQVANLIDAVAMGGLMRGSSDLAERLRVAEAELARLVADSTPAPNVERLLPDLAARYAQQLQRLPEALAGDVTRARTALARHIGPLTVTATEAEIQFWNEKGHAEVALIRAASSTASFIGSGGRI